ncbi:uncharacterized protein LOC124375457 [Silurus meridionalis]|uniref:Uncharacterized protein n=1 Tax=Silurus meridionalis TaxID=175797 RepID=A0A8T0AHH1_SILME|nr:uncharacterized protein LOC124375457 [Silurus meridionalis]KAF7691902.1 hypothetical protein HF521_010869 [Silurus meridionalis]
MANLGNSRSNNFIPYKRNHVILSDLKAENPDHGYLKKKDVPMYPDCVFRASNVCHVTEKEALHRILKDGGFRGNGNFLWWGLSVTDDDIADAEDNFLWQSRNQNPFLEKFTTSPAFQRESRYGNFRFTFTLRELLHAYSKKFCNKTAPILRILDTKLYKKEIAYSVVVHPRKIKHYRKCPRLPIDDTFLCAYRKGFMSWNCQSPSDNYEYRMKMNDGFFDIEPLIRPEYYVWDNIVLAFHMKPRWVLGVGRKQLFERLSVCETASIHLLKKKKMSFSEAEAEVQELKNQYL